MNIAGDFAHSLYYCREPQTILNEVINWLKPIIKDPMYFDLEAITIGTSENNVVVNFIVLRTKYMIHIKTSKGNGTNIFGSRHC